MDTASLDNLAGTVIGQYTLQKRLGVGGMGVVYSAFQNNLQRTVAVKLLPPAFAVQEGYNERFTREARTAAALEHAHIVPVYDYGTQGDLSYVVMRLLTGGTLAERIQSRTGTLPSLGEVAQLLNQIAGALGYAHSNAVIHRDIKTTNIMFDNQGSAFLVDFGIAKLLDKTSMTNTGLAIGTPTHMSPEQWRGETITPATDQYALAVVMYEVISGRLPFETNTVYALLNQHLNETPTSLSALRPDVPNAVTAVLDRALAKQPEMRYPTVQDLAADFEQAVKGAEGQSTNMFVFVINNEMPTVQDVHIGAMQLAAPSADLAIVGLPKTDPADKVVNIQLGSSDTPTAKASPEELDAIKRMVEQRIKRGRAILGFSTNLVAFVVVNLMLRAVFGSQWWLSVIAVGWLIGLLWHGFETLYGRDARKRRHQQELARELAKQGYDPSAATQVELDVSIHPSPRK